MNVKLVVVDFEMSPRTRRWALCIGLSAAVVGGVGALAFAANVPNQFVAGQPLTALALNQNFASLDGRVGQLETQQGTVPGAVMFFNLASCPPGWSALQGAQGRYVVGLGAAGTLAGTVGTALTDQENRPVGQHGHAISDPGHSHAVADPGHNHGGATGQEGGGGSTADDVAFGASAPGTACNWIAGGHGNAIGCYDFWVEHTHPISASTTGVTVRGNTTGIAVANAGAVAGTNAPYIQLLACQKN
jgi:hypothetical protein